MTNFSTRFFSKIKVLNKNKYSCHDFKGVSYEYCDLFVAEVNFCRLNDDVMTDEQIRASNNYYDDHIAFYSNDSLTREH